MSDEYLDDDIGLKPGVIVESSKTKYVIIKLLGEGGFGAVYKWFLPSESNRTSRRSPTAARRTKKATCFSSWNSSASLADLKAQRPEKVFSIPTDLGVGMQCLEAVEDLHKHGFIHRDLKPANYACGLGDKKHVVYILDCGIARRMLNDKSELKAPREYVRFKGTVRFASVNCHKNIELGWKDDCESCLYLVLDLIVASGLPWKRMSDKHEILKVPA